MPLLAWHGQYTMPRQERSILYRKITYDRAIKPSCIAFRCCNYSRATKTTCTMPLLAIWELHDATIGDVPTCIYDAAVGCEMHKHDMQRWHKVCTCFARCSDVQLICLYCWHSTPNGVLLLWRCRWCKKLLCLLHMCIQNQCFSHDVFRTWRDNFHLAN